MQPCTVSTKKLDDGQADWVGTSRGSRREHAVRSIIARWRAQQFESLRVIEYPDDDEVRETLDISESEPEFWQYFENTFRVVFRAQSFGNLASVLVRASDIPNGLRCEQSHLPSSFGNF